MAYKVDFVQLREQKLTCFKDQLRLINSPIEQINMHDFFRIVVTCMNKVNHN